MFTIKVTYLGQTRKHTFPDISTFPSYDDICLQLHRVFDITKDFYLSRLLFSPDAASASQILIGKEVHNAADYDKYIRQYKDRYWPNPLLRFSICETSSSSGFSSSAPILNIGKSSDSFGVTASYPSFTATRPPPQWPFRRSTNLSNITTAPSLAGENRRQDTFASFRRVEPSFRPVPRPTPQHRANSATAAACCAVSQGRAEVKEMLVNFQTNLNRVLTDNLAAPSRTASTSSVAATSAPPALCSVCTLNISESNSGRDTWYSCVNCHVVVCEHCYDAQRPGFCMSTKTDHVMKQADAPFIGVTPLAPAVPIAHLPSPWTPSRPSQPVAQTPGSSNASSISQQAPVIHTGIICDSCSVIVEGIRHKCLDCPDYDLCTSCITSGASNKHNPFHEFFEITEPGRVIVHTVFSGNGERDVGTSRTRIPSTGTPEARPAAAPQPTAHLATCDLCDSRIIGDRYKCTACPDFDACASCFNITREQHPGHPFVRITNQEDYIRANAAPRQKHYANCDGCQKTIYGVRFKCMHPQCPDYDLCDKCEALPIPVHPSGHPLLKITSPDTIIPSVYRVGQVTPTFVNDAPFVRSASYSASTTAKETTVAPELPVVSDDEPIKTPRADPYLPPWLRAESPFSEKVDAKAEVPVIAADEQRPPLPPKPEMISHASWASIPSLFPAPVDADSMQSLYYRNNNSTYADLVNPFADLPTAVEEASSPVEGHAHGDQQQMEERNISLPSVPSHLPNTYPNPWPTTNKEERQELLQLIADFAGPSTSAKVIRSLTDRPRRKNPGNDVTEAHAPLLDLSVENLQKLSRDEPTAVEKPQDVIPDVPVVPQWDMLFEAVERLSQLSTEEPAAVAQPATVPTEMPTPVPAGHSVEEEEPVLSAGFHDFQLSHLLERVEKLKVSEPDVTPSESSFSDAELLKRPVIANDNVERDIVSSSMADLIQNLQSFDAKEPEPVPEPEAKIDIVEPVPVRAAPIAPLSAAFVEDVTVPEGQIFPPGAEFVKCWRLLNDSGREWPESTSLVFVAGESLTSSRTAVAPIHVGSIAAGAEIDVWTSELKAPEAPGRYVGYWRLQADGEVFGNSLWIEINVAESDSHSSSENSMAASSIIMPTPSSVVQTIASVTAHTASISAATTEGFTEDNLSDAGSDISLISMPSSPSSDEDEALWHDTRSYTTAELAAAARANASRANSSRTAPSADQVASTPASAMDYVLLYDDNSSSESEA